MIPLAVSGAQITCSFSMPPVPVPLTAVPMGPPVLAGGMPIANINNHIPMGNIPSFGMCIAPTNPAFIAATSAALGVPTPVPCVPIVTAPWVPGSPAVLVNGAPAVNAMCMCMCTWLGVISVVEPGQVTVTG